MSLYLPCGELRVSGNSGLTLDETMLVTHRFNVAGDGDFLMNISEPPQAAPRVLAVWLEF